MFRLFLTCVLAIAFVSGDTTPKVYQPSPTQSYKPDPSPTSYQPPSGSYRSNRYEESPQDYSPQPYAFNYGVSDDYSGANFKAEESADGKAVSGSYQVALPDGRIQTVRYTVDGYNGFVADVQYEGTPVYPKYEPKNNYKTSPPSYRTQPIYNPPSQSSPPQYNPPSQSSPPQYNPPSQSSPPQYKPPIYKSNPTPKFKTISN
ncbi:uncharacterized protein [Lepeophtheirus salmonis]|uniref:uncharacterized protein n=1 Tax=Lepeophtheirus salmonis TaxID=72036 RepID=UPI001AE6C5E3|nr:early nodulin-75-like [Lepeophtheirus salmonis]